MHQTGRVMHQVVCDGCGHWVCYYAALTKKKNGQWYYYHKDCYYFD